MFVIVNEESRQVFVPEVGYTFDYSLKETYMFKYPHLRAWLRVFSLGHAHRAVIRVLKKG